MRKSKEEAFSILAGWSSFDVKTLLDVSREYEDAVQKGEK